MQVIQDFRKGDTVLSKKIFGYFKENFTIAPLALVAERRIGHLIS